MKLSLSLTDADVEFIDQYAADHDVESRSGVVQRAVSLLRAIELGDAYADAWDEWTRGDAELWDGATGDGLAS